MQLETLKQLLAASVDPSDAPVIVRRGAAQRALLETLAQEIGGDGVQAYVGTRSGEPRLSIEVDVAAGAEERLGYGFREGMQGGFLGDRLSLGTRAGLDETAVPLAGAAQLGRAIAAVRARLDGEVRRAMKRAKIRRIKERAVEAKVEALAREMDFSYHVEGFADRMRLAVALDDSNALFFDFPHGCADEALTRVKQVVAVVRKLRAGGAYFTLGAVDPERLRRPDRG
jgi:hypothetical protein